ncbi:MAG TPA: Ig-like domain-containing protein, partial [Candidatus Polarisedimenticolia bacterium]|nr:Ig-like domain-containing protein [Candidatus Polarisedimenticolia bacterium]
TAELTATLRSKNGTRLPDQEITFSTSNGTLDPPAETPLKTDNNGQAISLLITASSATITARSGGISGTTQVQTAPGNLAQFLLQVTPEFLETCDDTIMLDVTVRTTTGDPVQGIIVIFDETSDSDLSGTFSPASTVLSNASGIAHVEWTPNDQVCARECQAATSDPNSITPGDCVLRFGATDTTDTFGSNEVEVLDEID